jgi:hypothetical protein
MADILGSVSLFRRNHMEHTVTGIRDMHVTLMHLEVGVCQPEEKVCARCVNDYVLDTWMMGLNVRYIYCSKFLFPS